MLVPGATLEKRCRVCVELFWYQEMSKYNGNGCEVCSSWYEYVVMTCVDDWQQCAEVFHKNEYI